MNKHFLYLLALAHLSVDINSGSIAAILPFFVQYYGMDYTDVAGLMFASSFLSSVIQPLFGWLADRGSRQWFMPLGVLLVSISLGSTGFLTNYWAIFAAVTLMGIGSAIFHPEAARNVNVVSGTQRGQGMSIFSVGGNGGFGLGPLLAVFLISTFGMEGTAFYAAFGIVMSIVLLFVLPHIRRAAAPTKSATNPSEPQENMRIENDWPAFGRLSLVILFRSTVFTGLSSFLPLYCIHVLGSSAAVGSGTLSIISLTGIVATLVGGRLADRKGYVYTLRLACSMLVPCLAVTAFSGSIWGIYAILIPMSFAMQMPYSSIVVLGQSYLAKNVGFASGITLGVSFSIGGIVVPSLGQYADRFGLESLMALLVVLSFCAALATFLLSQPKDQRCV
ncbi:MFS transporter [Selenomonas sp. TAMA-11512]|uniref:MFS transporter n=1 Tax=Selenomonas sp. TAMA-11512 TaxID=3095337 RepID=UPI003093AE01|nr:MFS transporter [Selenomonas sp. TAMA-11512]